jgi:adenine phosphoribosyltransferase
MREHVEAVLRTRVRDIPDFPQPGVTFRDITPLLADGEAFSAAVDAMGAMEDAGEVDIVVGIEARGFILGAAVACRLGAGFVPMRKQGKLPHVTWAESYSLEYGSATIEVHQDALPPGSRVLVVDDVLATGGTAAAAVQLVRRSRAELVAVSVLIELAALHGREALPGIPLHSLLAY